MSDEHERRVAEVLKHFMAGLRVAIHCLGEMSPREHQMLGGALMGIGLAHAQRANVPLEDVIELVKALWEKTDVRS